MNLPAVLVVVFLVLSAVFFLLGPRLVRMIPAVRRFLAFREGLRNVKLNMLLLPARIDVSAFCKRELQEVVPRHHWKVAGVKCRHHALGDICDIVHHRELELRRTLRELRIYTFILLVLGGVGYLKFLSDNHFKFTLSDLLTWLGGRPLESIALFEAIMIALFSVKLALELMTISALVEG